MQWPIEMRWQTAAWLPPLFILIWLFTVFTARSFPMLKGKRIVLLIAHPDDEAMFFAPTLLGLTRPELGNHVKILCLSTGNADGLGDTRRKELVKSAMQLGIRREQDVLVLNDKHFPDSMSVTWNFTLISTTLIQAFAPEIAKIKADKPPKATIDAIVTFDEHGVSSHPNHKSLYHGANAFLKAIMVKHAGWECPVKLYTLTTTNVMRKYISFVDTPLTVLSAAFSRKEAKEFPTPLVFVSGPGNVRTAQNAMTSAHKSQMVWFRWGYIGFSRYMVLNDLVKAKGNAKG